MIRYIAASFLVFLFVIPAASQYQYRTEDNSEIIRSILEDRVPLKNTRPTQSTDVIQSQPITVEPSNVPSEDQGTLTGTPVKKSAARVVKKSQGEAPTALGADKALLESAIAFYDSGNDAAAIDRLTSLRDKYPTSPFIDQSSVYLARALLRQGKSNEALTELDRIAEDSGEYPSAMYLSGQIFRSSSRTDSAVERYARISSRFPSHPLADDALIELGKIYLSTKQGTLALKSAGQVIRQYPDRETLDDAYFLVGMVLEKDPVLRDVEKARLVFKKFIYRADVEKVPAFTTSPLKDRVKRELKFLNDSFFQK